MNNKELKRLLNAYQQGKCTDEERAMIETWLDKPMFGTGDLSEVDLHIRLAKTNIDSAINTGDHKKAYKFHYNNTWLGIAAGFAIFLICGVVAWHYVATQNKQLAGEGKVRQWVDKGWLNVSVPKGKRYALTLSDGSTVTLNALSKLRCPEKFIDHKRPVYLEEGEGLFEVAKDKTSPFTVYARNYATTALGTAFNIRAYSKENKISISLIHGKIRIDDLSKPQPVPRILTPHQQLVINKVSGRSIRDNFSDENDITGWKNGLLIFRDASADEVISAVENRFGVTIHNQCARKEWSYTGTFTNESLNEVLTTISLTEGIKFAINKNNIVLN